MALDFFNKIKIGSVYITSDGTTNGTRHISTVDGLEVFQLSKHVAIGGRGLDGTAYLQYSDIKDAPISMKFPLMDASVFDSVRDVIQGAITGLTTFTLDITGDAGTFAFNCKPGENTIRHAGRHQNGKLIDVEINVLATVAS